MHRIALIFLSCGWLMTGYAQDGQVLPDKDGMLSYEAFVLPEPDYTVEVIIFRNLDTGYNREEDWSIPELRVIELPGDLEDDELANDDQTANDSGVPVADSTSDPYSDNFFADETPAQTLENMADPDTAFAQDLLQDMEPLDCQALIEEALLMEGSVPEECTADIVRFIPSEPTLLAEAYLALENTANYRPLAVLAWSQPGYARSESPVFELRPLGVVGDAISGTVSLSRGRYLHLNLDLSFVPDLDFGTGLDLEYERNSESELISESDHHFESDTESATATMALVAGQLGETQTYRMNESRRMRRDEIHYFDHPEFAALAIVTRYEPPDPEGDDSEAGNNTADPATTARGN